MTGTQHCSSAPCTPSRLAETLIKYASKPWRTVLSLHSGTSTNGVDSALIRVSGSGEATRVEFVAHSTYEFPPEVREKLLEMHEKTATIEKVSQANFLLGEIFAKAARRIVDENGLSFGDVDVIGSSGQIGYHVRAGQNLEDIWFGDTEIPSAIDLGEGAVIAERTGVCTVANMRIRDIAAGGQGNPLVTYGDWVLFRHPTKSRIIQNIGGIANPTVLPAGAGLDKVQAFDTGPGNMVIDGVVKRLFRGKLSYDKNGDIARRGRVNDLLLSELMRHPYVLRKPPKTTGREVFGEHFIQSVLDRARELSLSNEDLVATVTAFSAESIAYNYRQFVLPTTPIDEILLCGGGSHNKTLVGFLEERLHSVPIKTVEVCGIPVDAREVVAVGVIADSTMLGHSGNVPSASGARRRVVMGCIFPGSYEL
ncbi:MAG: anhydro-N-acetylmuramic acid kinase [Bacteroidota bacterium]